MGFQRSAYKLVWPEGSRWHGLEVRLRGMSIGELEEISKLKGQTDGADLERLAPVLDILGSALLSWNYEDEDSFPIPIADFRAQDATLLLAVITAWTEVVGDVPAPLPSPSSDGAKSEEASMPMEIPSSSHMSLSMPN